MLLEITHTAEVVSNGGSDTIWTVIITLITALTGAGAWKFYSKKAALKAKQRDKDRQDSKDEREFYTDNLKERVTMLEEKLEKVGQQKEELLNLISELKVRNATLEVRLQSKIVKSRGRSKD